MMKYFQKVLYPEYLVTIVIGCSALMVSTVTYDSLPERFDRRENRWRLLFIFVFLIALLIKPRLMLFPFMISYVLFGVVREGLRLYGVRRRGWNEEQDKTKSVNQNRPDNEQQQ